MSGKRTYTFPSKFITRMVAENLGMNEQCVPTAWKANSRREGCIRRGVVIREMLYFALVKPHLEYCVHTTKI